MDETREMLREEFREPEARHDYADMFLDSSIALQIKALRQQREWSQEKLAERSGLKQSQISAMEQVTFQSWTLRTLRKLARAFDLALTVRFESFGWLLDDTISGNRKKLERPSFEEDPAFAASAQATRDTTGSGSQEADTPGRLLRFPTRGDVVDNAAVATSG